MRAYNAGEEARALRMMEECANDGHPTAMVLTAIMYRDGEGTAAQPERYKHWIDRFVALAHSGNAEAQWQLSGDYRFGNHFAQSIEKANAWLEQAAENGNPDAQYHLAYYLRYGDQGYSIDVERSEYWMECALKQGHPDALYAEAMAHYKDGRPTDYALDMLRRAAEKGLLQAQEELQRVSH